MKQFLEYLMNAATKIRKLRWPACIIVILITIVMASRTRRIEISLSSDSSGQDMDIVISAPNTVLDRSLFSIIEQLTREITNLNYTDLNKSLNEQFISSEIIAAIYKLPIQEVLSAKEFSSMISYYYPRPIENIDNLYQLYLKNFNPRINQLRSIATIPYLSVKLPISSPLNITPEILSKILHLRANGLEINESNLEVLGIDKSYILPNINIINNISLNNNLYFKQDLPSSDDLKILSILIKNKNTYKNFISPDFTQTTIKIDLRDLTAKKDLNALTDKFKSEYPNYEFNLVDPLPTLISAKVARIHVFRLSLVVILVTFLLASLINRSFIKGGLIILPGIISSIWLIGGLSFFTSVLPLNVYLVPFLLMPLGMTFSSLFAQGFSNSDDSIKLISDENRYVFLTLIHLAIASISLAIFNLSLLQFAVGLIIGLLCLIMSIYLIIPILSFASNFRIHVPIETNFINSYMVWLHKNYLKIVTAALVLVILGVISFRKMIFAGIEQEQLTVTPVSIQFESIKNRPLLKNLENLNMINAMSDQLTTRFGLTSDLDILELIKQLNFAINGVSSIPKDTTLLELITPIIIHNYSTEPNLLQIDFTLKNATYQKVMEIESYLKDLMVGRYAKQTADEGILLKIKSPIIEKQNQHQNMMYGQIKSLLLAIFIITLVIYFLTSSPRMVFLAMFPSIVSILINSIIFSYTDASLETSIAIILQILLVLGIDYSLNFINKYNFFITSLSRFSSILQAFHSIYQKIGLSIIYFIGSFAILKLSDFPQFYQISLVGIVALFINAIVSLTILVAILILIPGKQKNKD